MSCPLSNTKALNVASTGHKFSESALLENDAISKGDDVMGVRKMPRGVGTQDSCTSNLLKETIRPKNVAEDMLVSFSIESAQDIIKDSDVRLRAQSPSYCDPLALASTERDAVGANLGVVAVGKGVEIMEQSRGVKHLFVEGLVEGTLVEADDVLLDGSVDEERGLVAEG